MTDVESVVKTTLEEIERVLSTKTVVGEPMVVEGVTMIPMISIGFGFGAGAGSGKGGGKQRGEGEGTGGGGGGGAGIKPVAVIIIDKEGVRIETIKGGLASAMEKIGETVPSAVGKLIERLGERTGGQKKEG